MFKCESTKDELLLLLKKNKTLMIDEIKEHIPISDVAIRKQLRALEKENLVYKETQKQKIGRPSYVYSLTEKGHEEFPNRYKELPVELLQHLEELQGEEVVNALLDRHMKGQSEAIQKKITATDFDGKMEQLMSEQNKAGYMLEVEKTSEGHYILTNFNCPIANLATKYRQVCSKEKKMYNDVFENSEVIAEQYMNKAESHKCKWIIKPPIEK